MRFAATKARSRVAFEQAGLCHEWPVNKVVTNVENLKRLVFIALEHRMTRTLLRIRRMLMLFPIDT